MRIEIHKIRQAMTLSETDQLGFRCIARLLDTSHQTVARYAKEAQRLGLTKDKLSELDNVELENLLKKTPHNVPDSADIDWSFIDNEHHTKQIPLIVLWTEYSESMLQSKRAFIGEASFRRRYREWRRSQRISMRQFHAPGEKIFVDFAGKTVPIYSENTGEVKAAQIFVACLGASGLVFAHAVESQKMGDWLNCHIEMFKFFGGVSSFVVPDNLRSAVSRHTKQEVLINRSYQELAEHYQTIILPARVRKPKDKSLAEISVRIVQSWALNRLRNIKFFSIAELNEKLKTQIDALNTRITRTYPESRLTRFLNHEQIFLKPLPNIHYSVAFWNYGFRVPEDYHIKFKDSFYSVPYQYRQHLVDLRVTNTTIEIFNGAKRIASHLLIEKGHQTDINHMPKSHRIVHDSSFDELIEWSNSVGKATEQWCRHNLENKSSFANGKKAVENLRKFARQLQDPKRIESAAAFAIGLNTYSFTYLREAIRKNFDQKPVPEKTFFVTQHENIRGRESFINVGNKEC